MKKILKILKIFQPKFLCLYAMIFFITGYFYKSPLKERGIYDLIYQYFGVTSLFFLFTTILEIYALFLRTPKKRAIYSWRVGFFTLLVVTLLILGIMYQLRLPYEEVFITEEKIKELIVLGIYDYKIGLLWTFICMEIFLMAPLKKIYIALGIVATVSFMVLIFRKIRVSITNYITTKREKRRLELEKKAVMEQIRILEEYENQNKDKFFLSQRGEKDTMVLDVFEIEEEENDISISITETERDFDEDGI